MYRITLKSALSWWFPRVGEEAKFLTSDTVLDDKIGSKDHSQGDSVATYQPALLHNVSCHDQDKHGGVVQALAWRSSSENVGRIAEKDGDNNSMHCLRLSLIFLEDEA